MKFDDATGTTWFQLMCFIHDQEEQSNILVWLPPYSKLRNLVTLSAARNQGIEFESESETVCVSEMCCDGE